MVFLLFVAEISMLCLLGPENTVAYFAEELVIHAR